LWGELQEMLTKFPSPLRGELKEMLTKFPSPLWGELWEMLTKFPSPLVGRIAGDVDQISLPPCGEGQGGGFMKALILAAGYGTRLASIIKDTPKPLITVGHRPMIDYVVDMLQGIKSLSEIVVVSNNKFTSQFQKWAGTLAGIPVRVVNDGTNTPEERLGSVGDIRFVWQKEPSSDDWLIIGGDNLFDGDVSRFMDFAISKSPAISVGVYDIKDIEAATKFGVLAIDANQKVISFQEKPKNPASSLITMCLYYFPKQTLAFLGEYLKESKAVDAAGSYIKWLSEEKNVYGFQFSGKWYDIGSIESLEEARAHFK
jgi:glucose-1-phosphate thymidylyltransferase